MTGGVRCLVWAAYAAALGCASTSTTGSSLDAKFAGSDARRARELAPDLYAEAEHARDDARVADDDAVQRDAIDRASLFLDAASAEAERIQFDRERARIDAAIERAVSEQVEHTRARLAAEAETARAEAARLARAEAQREFDRSTDQEFKRTKKSERERVYAASAAFLLGRAELVLAAAIALGLPAEARADAERVLAEAAAPGRTARDRLSRAQRALDSAEHALAVARATPETPDSSSSAPSDTPSLRPTL